MRIGVFICHCGLNIAGVINIPKVMKSVKDFENVVYVEDNTYSCSASGTEGIKDSISEHDLDRVVVAACTPRTHEYLYRSICEEAGLNPYLFQFVNIREQCSWVHSSEPEDATKKAIELIRMGVAKAALLEPLDEKEVEVEPSAMVIGAGVSGMTAALSIAKHGFRVYLIEKKPEVGGMLEDHNLLFPTDQDASELLELYKDEISREGKIKLLTSTTLKKVDGFIGNFNVTVESQGEEVNFKVGAIIVATGAVAFEPKGLYGYGDYECVMTQLQFQKASKDKKIENPKNVVMIQCAGSRGAPGGVPYCSRICCISALKNAVHIKERNTNAKVYLLFREMQTHGPRYEDYYKRAKEKGVRFVRYDLEKQPEVTKKNGELNVKVYNKVLQEEIEIPSDLVVLSTPIIPQQDAKNLSEILRVSLGMDNFFLETHIKLRPAEFTTDGVYLCGTAHAPKDIHESVINALGAAAKALIPLEKGRVRAEAMTARINEDICIGCGKCVNVCPYEAISLDEIEGVAKVVEVMCKGCGSCSVKCPVGAVQISFYRDEQILAMIDNLFMS